MAKKENITKPGAVHNYNYPTRVRFGTGVRSEIPAALSSRGLKKVLIVTDKGFAGLPVFAQFESELKSKAEKVSAAYGKTVVRETHTGKVNGVSNATGMVIYFPTSTMSYNRKYDSVADIKFAEQPAWGSFLKSFAKN